MPKYLAKVDNYGFRGRYWHKDDTVITTVKEAENSSEIKAHWRPWVSPEQLEIEQTEAELAVTEEEDSEPTEDTEFSSMPIDELRDKCKDLGLPFRAQSNRKRLINILKGE